MPRQRQEPCPGRGRETAPGMDTLPRGIKFPGGIKTGEAGPQHQPSSLELPQQLELLPQRIRGLSRSCRGEPGRERHRGHRCPFPPQGHHRPTLTHPDTPRFPLTLPAWETPPGTALDLGALASKALAPPCPSGCPALTSLLGNRGFPEHWHIRGRNFNPDPRICWEGKNLEVVYSPMGNSNLTCSGPCGSASIETLQWQQRSVQKMTLNTAKVVSLSFQQFAFWANSVILCLRLYFTCPRQVLHHSHKFWLCVLGPFINTFQGIFCYHSNQASAI